MPAGSQTGFPQCAKINRDIHRFTEQETGMKKSKALTIDKEPSLTDNKAFCVLALQYNKKYYHFSSTSEELAIV